MFGMGAPEHLLSFKVILRTPEMHEIKDFWNLLSNTGNLLIIPGFPQEIKRSFKNL